MATRCQPHGTRWLKFGSIQVIMIIGAYRVVNEGKNFKYRPTVIYSVYY